MAQITERETISTDIVADSIQRLHKWAGTDLHELGEKGIASAWAVVVTETGLQCDPDDQQRDFL
jgi:hypothetical protein